MLNFQ